MDFGSKFSVPVENDADSDKRTCCCIRVVLLLLHAGKVLNVRSCERLERKCRNHAENIAKIGTLFEEKSRGSKLTLLPPRNIYFVWYIFMSYSQIFVCAFRNFPTQIFGSSTHVYHSLPWKLTMEPHSFRLEALSRLIAHWRFAMKVPACWRWQEAYTSWLQHQNTIYLYL